MKQLEEVELKKDWWSTHIIGFICHKTLCHVAVGIPVKKMDPPEVKAEKLIIMQEGRKQAKVFEDWAKKKRENYLNMKEKSQDFIYQAKKLCHHDKEFLKWPDDWPQEITPQLKLLNPWFSQISRLVLEQTEFIWNFYHTEFVDANHWNE